MNTDVDRDFCQGGRASEAKNCRCSKAELHEQVELPKAGVHLRALEDFWFLMLKCILPHLSFLTSSSTL